MRAQLFATTSLLLIGAGVGWLVGLAVSPVVAIVLTSVMGTVAALVAALSGLSVDGHRPSIRVNPLPTALLILGIVAGSLLGLRARNANWLGYSLAQEVARWQAAGLPMDPDQIVLRLFEQEYPSRSAPAEAAPQKLGAGTYLFAVEAQECAQLRLAAPDDLAPLLRTLSDSRLHILPEIMPDSAQLARYVDEVLCAPTD
jgi:hypothetical protein